jgi:glycosyltransferase involved in cell wall biosynthesis
VPQLPQSALVFPGFTSAKKFLFLGRKDSKKGITDVVNALRLLCLRYPNVILVCAGPETSYSKSLWQEIPESLQPHLLVLDTVSEAEKRALILDSEALILMSTTESFGIVFLEAWLEGKPVIGARAGAIEAVIEDGADGLLVEPGNYVELAATMQFLLEHPEVGAELGARGKAKTLRQFTWDAVAEQWSRIFWEINKSE